MLCSLKEIEVIEVTETFIDVLFGTLGVFLSYFIGGLDGLLAMLVVFVICDYISGTLKGLILGKFSSDVGFNGIARKVYIFIFVGIANVMDHELLGNSEVLRDGVVMFYLANEGLSISENAIEMGVPVPEAIKDRFLCWRNKQLISKNKPEIDEYD